MFSADGLSRDRVAPYHLTMDSYLVKTTADVGLPAIGPELTRCLDRVARQLDGCGAESVQVAVRGDAQGLVVAVGCVASDRTFASIEALEMLAAALGGAGLDYADIRLA